MKEVQKDQKEKERNKEERKKGTEKWKKLVVEKEGKEKRKEKN